MAVWRKVLSSTRMWDLREREEEEELMLIRQQTDSSPFIKLPCEHDEMLLHFPLFLFSFYLESF